MRFLCKIYLFLELWFQYQYLKVLSTSFHPEFITYDILKKIQCGLIFWYTQNNCFRWFLFTTWLVSWVRTKQMNKKTKFCITSIIFYNILISNNKFSQWDDILKPMPEAMVLHDKQTITFLFIRCIDKFSVNHFIIIFQFKLLSHYYSILHLKFSKYWHYQISKRFTC